MSKTINTIKTIETTHSKIIEDFYNSILRLENSNDKLNFILNDEQYLVNKHSIQYLIDNSKDEKLKVAYLDLFVEIDLIEEQIINEEIL